jgi:hypothetical protein
MSTDGVYVLLRAGSDRLRQGGNEGALELEKGLPCKLFILDQYDDETDHTLFDL